MAIHVFGFHRLILQVLYIGSVITDVYTQDTDVFLLAAFDI